MAKSAPPPEDSKNPAPIVDVAVGVLQRPDGRVLLAQRPTGKPEAGFWEFPGGKIEAGEDRVAALKRELREELGVEALEAQPWISREHAYPRLTARLHLFRIPRWRGTAQAREGQRLRWEDPRAVAAAPLLEANHTIIRALALPRIYAITKASAFGQNEFLQRLRTALEKGVRLVQLREPSLEGTALAEFAAAVCALAHAYGARVLCNSAHETPAQADGIHLQTEALMRCRERPSFPLCAASCHNREELLHAAAIGVDFAVLSPVLPTPTHPDAPALGWETFSQLCRDLPMPVFALGGMRTELLEQGMRHNAHGLALLSGIW